MCRSPSIQHHADAAGNPRRREPVGPRSRVRDSRRARRTARMRRTAAARLPSHRPITHPRDPTQGPLPPAATRRASSRRRVRRRRVAEPCSTVTSHWEEHARCPSRPSASSSRPTMRNFGRFGDAVEVPPLTDVQTRSYDRFLQLDVAAEKRAPAGLEGVLQGNLPDRELRQDDLARVHQVRARQAALRPGRVPPAPPDLRPAVPRLAAPAQATAAASRKRSTSATCRS